jgi:amino acid adenylation domain-containing protein
VMKSGAAYLPIDIALPGERIASMLEDAKPPVIVGHRASLNKLPPHAATVLLLDDESPSAQPGMLARVRYNPENIAYVLYTSGSTGKPNGVQVPHGALVNFLISMKSTPGLIDTDVMLGLTTLSFDIAGLELLLPLICGAKVVIVDRQTAMDANLLAAEIERRNVTVMQATPATWRMLLDSGWQGSKKIKMLCGGEALSRDLAERLLKIGACLWNMYGPTETTIWSAACEIKSGTGPVYFGGPIANTQIYVLDEHLQPQPIGVPGEIYIGGGGVARGYLNRPELTAARFIRDPFTGNGERCMYKTGDLARRRADGQLEFIGRTDHQVKIRGYRIELAEIEAALKQHPAVHEVVVVAREFSTGEKRLVAYIVAKGKEAPTAAVLRPFLKTRLPEYMMPNLFEILDAFPLTPNGKVDRKALPNPREAKGATRTYVPPRTNFEKVLCGVWAEMLKVPQVGIQDNFFELGGHSMLAMQSISRISEVLQLKEEIPMRYLFDAQTLGEFAELTLRQSPHRTQIEKASELAIMLAKLSPAEVSKLAQKKNLN